MGTGVLEANALFENESAAKPYNFAPPKQWAEFVIRVLQGSGNEPTIRALDIGCGPGQFLFALSSIAVNQTIGLDCSAAMLLKAKQNFGTRFSLVRGDAISLPFKSDSFDLTLIRYLLHHLRRPAMAIREASRAMMRGGRLLVETSDPTWLRIQPEYRDFPAIATIDLARWPTRLELIEWMEMANFDFRGCFPIHFVRDYISREQYLARLEIWEREGGGTSFWRLFDSNQRQQFVEKKVLELAEEVDANCIPIFSHGMMLVGQKR